MSAKFYHSVQKSEDYKIPHNILILSGIDKGLSVVGVKFLEGSASLRFPTLVVAPVPYTAMFPTTMSLRIPRLAFHLRCSRYDPRLMSRCWAFTILQILFCSRGILGSVSVTFLLSHPVLSVSQWSYFGAPGATFVVARAIPVIFQSVVFGVVRTSKTQNEEKTSLTLAQQDDRPWGVKSSGVNQGKKNKQELILQRKS